MYRTTGTRQLCQLALHYAQRGDAEFAACLYDFVERKPIPDSPEIGEGQLLELGGEEAFRFLARVRGKLLETRSWDWDNSALVDRAIENLGEERTAALLDSSADPAVRRFADAWRENRRQPEKADAQSHRERVKAIPASDVLEAAYGAGNGSWFRYWGTHTDRSELETILHVLWTARDSQLIVKLLRVFSRRPLPRFDARLIKLCRHSDDEVKWWALTALEMNVHPRVREFALNELQASSSASAVGLLVRNFAQGDEQRLLDLADLPEDPCRRHSMLIDLMNMLEENHDADCSQLAVIAYAQTPCEICRCGAAKLLIGKQVAPGWMLEECRHDSSDECRELTQQE